jgi:hypothetical protein
MGLLADIFGISAEQQRGEALDAQLRALNLRDYAPGGRLYTPERWAIVQRNLELSKTGNIEAQLWLAALAGAGKWITSPSEAVQLTKEGAQLVGGAVGQVAGYGVSTIADAVKSAAKELWRSIPGWVWVLVIVYLLFKLGIHKMFIKNAN